MAGTYHCLNVYLVHIRPPRKEVDINYEFQHCTNYTLIVSASASASASTSVPSINTLIIHSCIKLFESVGR